MTVLQAALPKKRLTNLMAKLCFMLLSWVFLSGWYVFYILDTVQNDFKQGKDKVSILEKNISVIDFSIHKLIIDLQDIAVESLVEKYSIKQSKNILADLDKINIRIQNFERDLGYFDLAGLSKDTLVAFELDKSLIENGLYAWQDDEVVGFDEFQKVLTMLQKNISLAKNIKVNLLSVKEAIERKHAISSETLQWIIVVICSVTSILVLIIYFMFKVRYLHGINSLSFVIRRYINGYLKEEIPYEKDDEFRDAHFLLGQLKDLSLVHYQEMSYKHDFFLTAFNESASPSLLVDRNHVLVGANQTFEKLWLESSDQLIKHLDLAVGESLIGAKMDEAHFVWLQDSEQKFLLDNSLYKLVQTPVLKQGKSLGYVLRFDPISEITEAKIINKSIALLANDSWDVPIRVLRQDSIFFELSLGLEEVRKNNKMIFANVNDIFGLLTAQEIKSLRQLNAFLSSKDALVVEDKIASDVNSASVNQQLIEWSEHNSYDKWQEHCHLNVKKIALETIDQLESSVLLGYESIFQRVFLVHKDMKANIKAL